MCCDASLCNTHAFKSRNFALLQGAGEELGLDISQVDALTLRQLQHYVHSCFNAGDSAVSWPGCLVGSGRSSLSCQDGRVTLAADFRDAEAGSHRNRPQPST